MFTGIIENIGQVKRIKKGSKSISIEIEIVDLEPSTTMNSNFLNVGDSIAVNGVCLTATSITGNGFTADAMPETMKLTTLSFLQTGSKVNLERALTLQSRLGGHIIAGHIDGIGTIINISINDNAKIITLRADTDIIKYIVKKGSVALDGISLTVIDVNYNNNTFSVGVIPHTQGNTTLKDIRVGAKINVEIDLMIRYLERLSHSKNNNKNLYEQI